RLVVRRRRADHELFHHAGTRPRRRAGAVDRQASRSSFWSSARSTRSRFTVTHPKRPTYAALANVSGSRSIRSAWVVRFDLIETWSPSSPPITNILLRTRKLTSVPHVTCSSTSG